jgi:hypothetical protein
MLALGRREAEHIAHAFPEVSRRVGGYLIDALAPAQAGQPGHAAVRLGGDARHLAPPRAEALPAAQEQGARHLPLRHLPQAMEATQHIVKLGPVAVEVVDRTLIELARDIAMFAR